MSNPPSALAVYGTLRPGEPNHWVVKHIAGQWRPGVLTGWIFTIGWGAAEGYLGFIPDADGQPVAVEVLISDDLDRSLYQIDDFEGDGYERRVVEVTLDDDTVVPAWVYVARTDNDDNEGPPKRRRR